MQHPNDRRLDTYTYMYMYTCMYTSSSNYTCMYMYIHIYVYVYTHMYLLIWASLVAQRLKCLLCICVHLENDRKLRSWHLVPSLHGK